MSVQPMQVSNGSMNTNSLTDSPPINEFREQRSVSDGDMDEKSSPDQQIKCIMSSEYIQNSKKLQNKTDDKGIICVNEFGNLIGERAS